MQRNTFPALIDQKTSFQVLQILKHVRMAHTLIAALVSGTHKPQTEEGILCPSIRRTVSKNIT